MRLLAKDDSGIIELDFQLWKHAHWLWWAKESILQWLMDRRQR